MAKGTRRDRGKTKNQRRDQIERKRDERSQRNALRKGKQANEYGIDDDTFKSFRNQLQLQGLKMRDVVGDGNCLFRALADQLDGNESMHGKHRKETVSYIKEHKEEFIPFLEETVRFEDYLKNLSSPGTYGGNDSIVAFARNNGADIIIHQHNNPTFIIEGSHASAQKIIIHLAYHDYEHYSSVRRCNDPGTGPGYTFHKERDSMATESSSEKNEVVEVNEENQGKSMQKVEENSTEGSDDFISEAVERIRNDCGYEDSEYIRNAFVDNSYDIDSTLSFILQMMSLCEDNKCCTTAEISKITQNDLNMNNESIVDKNVCEGNEKESLEVEIRDDSVCVQSEELLPPPSCQQVFNEQKTPASKCTCDKDKENKLCTLKCACDKDKKGKSCTLKCTCDKDKEGKEKSFQEVRKKNIPENKTVKNPSNRQRKELAKQARKKRRQESKKDSNTTDSPPSEKTSENIKSINI